MSLTRSDAIVELGKRLVAELSTDEDLLASWMAHDIAEKIAATETAKGKAKTAAETACAKAILMLWEYRESLPRRFRPFRELEPALRTLASLDIDRKESLYFPNHLRAAEDIEPDEPARTWLSLAIGLDHTARILIAFSLREAAATAATNAIPWVTLAQEAGIQEDVEEPLIRFVLDPDERIDSESYLAINKIKDKLAKLEEFMRLATVIADELRVRLSVLDDVENEPI
ncbi:AVAST type 3 anti-phage proein Avs3b [Stenotrophomonas sp. NRRL B-14846]|uniref:AVAST type 3 anti-phage proein Avs3b n=1 Tax=Stenotrophomonas sp. NRRL B-14846 TaxID=3162882 RepID=UPI003D2910E8